VVSMTDPYGRNPDFLNRDVFESKLNYNLSWMFLIVLIILDIILRACNMAAPPSLNLLGEFRLLNRLVSWSWIRIFLLIFFIFFLELFILYTCFRIDNMVYIILVFIVYCY
jgi:hypothetical protein